MIQSLKDACSINLGFPYQKSATPAESNIELHHFIAERSRKGEPVGNEHASELLEKKLVEMFGVEAALWFPTGTLAQGVAARIHTVNAKNPRLLLHPSSHLLLYEDNGYELAHDCKALVKGAWRDTLDATDINDDVGCVFIEMPQRHGGGKLPSWEALTDIKARSKAFGIPLHMDGARLWSSRPFYSNRSYPEIISGFDSVYVSFYKDIGAMGGAALLGSDEFIQQAQRWRTRLGGYSVGSWPAIYDALRCLDKSVALMPEFVTHAQVLADAIRHFEKVNIDPAVPHTNLFHVLLPVPVKVAEAARDKLANKNGIWLADRFWPEPLVDDMGEESSSACAMEIVVGGKALDINAEQFANAVGELLSFI